MIARSDETKYHWRSFDENDQYLLSEQPIKTNLFDELYQIIDLHHPNIVSLKSFYHFENDIITITEFCSGTTLKQFMTSFPSHHLPEPLIRSFLHPLFKSISYLHQKGHLHSQLSPNSILLTPSPKLLPPGLSTYTHHLLSTDQLPLSSLLFLPPENLDSPSSQFTSAGDIWAMGVVMYVMVVGELPFVVRGREHTVKNIVS
jgi:serine/threonine protein kinase